MTVLSQTEVKLLQIDEQRNKCKGIPPLQNYVYGSLGQNLQQVWARDYKVKVTLQ